MKLRKKSKLIAILVGLAVKTENSLIPAIGNGDLDLIGIPKEIRYIVDLVLQSLSVIGPAGRHTAVTDGRTIDRGFIDSMRCDVEAGAADPLP